MARSLPATVFARAGRGLVFLASMVLAAPVMLAVGIAAAVWATVPAGDATLTVPGLSARVGIQIDIDGIPRIRAATLQDAAAALGVLHARERLFQMELMRRAASGRLSELAGHATLPLDRMARTLGLRRAAERALAGLDARTRGMLDAYASGVNAWSRPRGRRAGLEFLLLGPPEPWAPVDSLLWGETMAVYLSGNWRTELARLALAGHLDRARIDALWPTPAGRLASIGDPGLATWARIGLAQRLGAVIPAFPDPFTLPDEASNGWAVDGRHGAGGAPVLAGDPHLGFSLPGIWYLARLDTPEGIRVGATAPGVPMLVLGHNGQVAWTFTTASADTEDLFIETPAGADRYVTPDGPLPFVTRPERIRVAGAPDEILTVRETRHGPVVSDLIDPHGPILALSAAQLMAGDTAAAGLLELGAARDLAEVTAAATRITAPVQNLIAADRSGIALVTTGRVPRRRAGDGAWPQPGGDGAHDWVGWASGAELPQIIAPAAGRIVNANEPVAAASAFMDRDTFGGLRASRIATLLDTRQIWDAAGFSALQVDATDPLARAVLLRLLTTSPGSAADRAALDLLRGWDGRMAVDRPQPLIFTAWMRRFAADLLVQAGAPAATAAAAPWPDRVAARLADPAPAEAILAASLAGAVSDLSARFGPDPARWRWGEAHPAVFAHPLLRAIPGLGRAVEGRIAAPGGETTVDRGGMAGDGFTSVHGASFRAAYPLADLDASRFVVAPGQSGHVASPHARDFLQRWRDGETVTLGPYAPAAATLTLLPAGGSP